MLKRSARLIAKCEQMLLDTVKPAFFISDWKMSEGGKRHVSRAPAEGV